MQNQNIQVMLPTLDSKVFLIQAFLQILLKGFLPSHAEFITAALIKKLGYSPLFNLAVPYLIFVALWLLVLSNIDSFLSSLPC